MTAPLTLAALAGRPIWVGWREEVRKDQPDAKPTKVPYNPRTGAKAKCNDPATWATRNEAETWALERRGNGVALIFTQTDDAVSICGIDLDTCRDRETGAFAPWAQEVIDRLNSYVEISPSKTGAKVFFTVANADLPAALALFDGRTGCKFTNGGGGEHPPAIEVYCTNRFFAVTDWSIGPEDLRVVSIEDLRWLLQEAGPKFAGKSNGADNSRSGKAFRAGVELKANGASYEEMRAALIDHEDPDIAAWAQTKGTADGEREMRRIFDKTQEPLRWSEPKPLPEGLLPVPTFDLGFLPRSIGPWVEDIADLKQCPLDFVAIPAMVALGSVLGRKIAIRPQRKTDWTEVANLWGLTIGRPGAMKSPSMSEAMKSIRRLEMRARERHEAALTAHVQATEEHKLRKDAATKRAKEALTKDVNAALRLGPDEPKPPKERRYIVDDATYERLGEILADNPNGVLAFRDEIVPLFRLLDREEYASAKGFFLAAWSGMSGYRFDRISRGATYIPAVCISLLGTTQPGKIAEYIGRTVQGGEGDDGMIQRFSLMVWPDQTPEWKEPDRYPDSEARRNANGAFDLLDKIRPEDAGALIVDEPLPFLNFDNEAQALFSSWHRELEMALRGEELSPALKGHFAKYKKLVPTLALINHLADGGCGDIQTYALERAVAFSKYLEAHARRTYAAGTEGETSAARAILARIREGRLIDGFSARDVKQSNWASLSNAEHVEDGLTFLADLGWLQEKTIKTGGRPRTTYFINPNIRT